MSLKNIQGPAVAKAPLSEIFAAMKGVIFAGIGAGKNHPLNALALSTAQYTYSIRANLIKDPTPDNCESVARWMLMSLERDRVLLGKYDNIRLQSPPHGIANSKKTKVYHGGTVGDVLGHIDYILAREVMPGLVRPVEEVDLNGQVARLEASYLPAARGTNSAKTPKLKTVETATDANAEIGGTPKPSAPKRRAAATTAAPEFVAF